jgi:hypothetical protein
VKRGARAEPRSDGSGFPPKQGKKKRIFSIDGRIPMKKGQKSNANSDPRVLSSTAAASFKL